MSTPGTGAPGVNASAPLAQVLHRIEGVAVGCVGDLMLDRYVHGAAERISPEAPVPVLRVERTTAMLGGAGNVVRNLAALGARVRFAALLGADPAARAIRDLLAAEGDGVHSELIVDAARTTTVKTRFLAGAQQLLRCDDESTEPASAEARAALLAAVEGWCDGCAVVVLSDYAKGALAGGIAAELIAIARARDIPVVVDPKGTDFARYRGARVVTPNRRELGLALGTPIAPGEEAAAATALRRRFGFGAVLLTLGRDGMILIDGDDGAIALPTDAREVFDVSGAGDTVVAGLAAALAAGAGLADAAALANTAAGIVVGKVGTAVVRAAELARALRHSERLQADEKLLDLPTATERVEGWRRLGLRVGFTNGCFDLVHPGHVSLLNQARAACGRLVVGLNTDASVARLKGPGRPIQGEAARATVLASMAAVDAVVLFGEETPIELIRALRPDVLIKGADYRLEQVVGADLVHGWGGRVLLAELAPGHSTTATLAGLER